MTTRLSERFNWPQGWGVEFLRRLTDVLRGIVTWINTVFDQDVTVNGGVTADTITIDGSWDDLRFPAQSINPVGGVDAPTQDAVETSFPGTLLFSGSRDDMIAGVAQMPHAWKRGTAIRPHIHWSKPTGSANAVTWELYIRDVKNPDEVAGAWGTAITGTLAAGTQTVSDNHLLTSFGDVAMTDREESVIICWRLYRRGSTDAESNAVRLYEFDFHYQTDKPGGTVAEIPTP